MLKFYAFLSESKVDATYQSALGVLLVFWHAILLFPYSLSHTQAEVPSQQAAHMIAAMHACRAESKLFHPSPGMHGPCVQLTPHAPCTC
jgi:hypothetical protein